MSRLIDADKFKKYLLEKFGPSQDSTVLFLYGLIAEQPTVEQDNWISCSDRLPDDYVNVLTCDKKGNMHIFSHCKGYEYPFCIPPDHTRYYMPVAWQPLPQKYKGITK